jgi:hypothetical protein
LRVSRKKNIFDSKISENLAELNKKPEVKFCSLILILHFLKPPLTIVENLKPVKFIQVRVCEIKS